MSRGLTLGLRRYFQMLPARAQHFVHNAIAHPVSEVLGQISGYETWEWLHDGTQPVGQEEPMATEDTVSAAARLISRNDISWREAGHYLVAMDSAVAVWIEPRDADPSNTGGGR